jgi:hypothetical protein
MPPSFHPDTPASSQASAPRYCDGREDREGHPLAFGSRSKRIIASEGTPTAWGGRTVRVEVA